MAKKPTYEELEQKVRRLEEAVEHKRVEEELRRSEEKYRILVEQSPLGISMVGKNGNYKYVNPKFIEMFGYTLEDIPTGRQWFAKAPRRRRCRRRW